LSALALAGGVYVFVRFSDCGRSLAETMQRDMKVIKERDPAARSNVEILTCYPGLHAIWFHRASHALWQRDIPLAPRLISQVGRLLTGIEIHPGATLGDGLFIDHGSGVVIGETSEIGENVTIYQGVTLGGTGKETGKRHPTVGDNVVIGAGSQLLGSIKVGDHVKVGAGSVVVHDVPSDSTVVGNPGRPVIMGGAKVAIPDIDYTHLPDPVAEAMKCLVRRVVGLENELEEVRASDARAAASDDPSQPSEEAPGSDDACDPARVDGLPEI
jgi:serine O-acetyltransferase